MDWHLDEQPRRATGSSRGHRPRRRPRWLAAGILGVLAATALGTAGPVAAAKPTFGDVRVFASAPAPGHPFGIAVDDDGMVYVSTSAGDFFACHQNSDDERVFSYDEDGRLVRTTVIDTADNSDMGLFGLALDGNTGKHHQLYVADMNGRILRLGVGGHRTAPQVFSQVPASTGLAGDWMMSMWNDLVFD
jgi:outer membrane protein assembly factor BamB